MSNCLTRVKEFAEKAGLRVSNARLDEFAKQLDAVNAASMTPKEFAVAAQALFDEQIERMAQLKRAERLMNMALVKKAATATKNGTLGGKDIVDNARNFAGGGAYRPSEGGRIDPMHVAATLAKRFQNMWDQGVRPLRDIVQRRLLIDEIFQELDALRTGGKVGLSGSPEAAAIARVIRAVNNEIFDTKKAYNPHMERNAEFLTNRFHERERVLDAGKDAWVAKADAAFGAKTFPDMTPQERIEAFEGIFERIKNGTFGTVVDAEDADIYVKGTSERANILRRMAKGRTLVANDWRAEAAYFKEFGPETFGDLMGKVMERAGKDIALLSKYGTEPRQNWKAYKATLRAMATPEERTLLDAAEKELDGIFAQAIGDGDAPANNMKGKIGRGTLNGIYAAKTGLSFFRMWSDLGLAPGIIRGMNGKSIPENAFLYAGEYLKMFTSDTARREALEGLAVYSSSVRATILGGLGSPGVDGGILGNIAEKIGILGFHRRHAEASKAAMAVFVSRDLGRMADTEFAGLPARFKNTLSAYGLNEHEWNFFRENADEWAKGGAFKGAFLQPESAHTAPKESVIAYMKAAGKFTAEGNPSGALVKKSRTDLSNALGSLLNDHAAYGSTTASTRQKAFMYRGLSVNDTWGMMARLFWQFKAASLVSLDSYRRIYYAGGGPRGDWAGVAQTMGAVMFWWSMGEYARQALEGKTLEDPATVSFAGRALLASGAGGLASDVILGAARQEGVMASGMGAVSGVMGPAASLAGEAIGIGKEYLQTAMHHYQGTGFENFPNRKMADFVAKNTPGLNLMGVGTAFNHYVMNGVREFLDVGYLGHLEQQVMQTPGLTEERQRYFMLNPNDSPRWLQ